MHNPWAGQGGFRCGWLRQLGALSALFGFLFSATTPGLALVNTAGQSVAVGGMLGVYVCHAQGGKAASSSEAPSSASECCLICQAAQLANGAVPPQHFTLPTESAAIAHVPAGAHHIRDGKAQHHAQARAPPAA